MGVTIWPIQVATQTKGSSPVWQLKELAKHPFILSAPLSPALFRLRDFYTTWAFCQEFPGPWMLLTEL